jgi:two-component system OmpR family response regulator
MKHILVMDDDADVCTALESYLQSNGFRVSTVADGRRLGAALVDGAYYLLLLDAKVPGEDGLDLCRSVRERSRLPIVMMSSRGEEVDRIVGLEMGADDYVAKPFNSRELLARIKAILRRAGHSDGPPLSREYRFQGYRLDVLRRTLFRPDAPPLALSGAQFELLTIFLERPHRVLPRELLVEITQQRDAPAYDRSIDVRVSRLRQALCERERAVPIIRTVYGEGYVFTAEVDRVPMASQ